MVATEIGGDGKAPTNAFPVDCFAGVASAEDGARPANFFAESAPAWGDGQGEEMADYGHILSFLSENESTSLPAVPPRPSGPPPASVLAAIAVKSQETFAHAAASAHPSKDMVYDGEPTIEDACGDARRGFG